AAQVSLLARRTARRGGRPAGRLVGRTPYLSQICAGSTCARVLTSFKRGCGAAVAVAAPRSHHPVHHRQASGVRAYDRLGRREEADVGEAHADTNPQAANTSGLASGSSTKGFT